MESFEMMVALGIDRARLYLRGELDMAAAPTLVERLEKVCGDGRSLILIDLSELTYCDSVGLRALLQAAARCAKDGTQMQVTGARGAVRRVIELTDTADSLNLVEEN